ncbi:MAG TPA: hypothetical protein DCM40_26755 [Maribacter sp.]|jgi:hypothetical protein|nr:hypothetical protein [Maribacter sp.]|tara:strand:- start:4949 stop:5884 length:936 start_codon:yes stop_codon:yes gene_type:complete
MSNSRDKRTFKFADEDYAVIRPKIEQVKEANEIRAKVFNDALQGGDLLRDQLDNELRKRELWNDEREKQYQALRKKVVDGEYSLTKGGIKLSEAKDIALEMARSRAEMISMLSGRSELDSITCEGKADAARFNFLFSRCLVYNTTEEPYFKEGYDEYMANQDDPVAVAGATEFFYLMSGTEDLDQKLPENKFLKEFDYVDDKFRLVDNQGKLIDYEGNHIDENGNLIKWINDDEYIFVDITGREVTKSGDWEVEFSPFLDDDGNPVSANKEDDTEEEVEEVVEEAVEEPPKKRRGRPKKADTEKNKEAHAS